MIEIAIFLSFGIAIGAALRVAYLLGGPVLSDMHAAYRLALREFRNRRWIRRIRAQIQNPFD